MKDFTPTKEMVSLHGLGFIQVVLPSNQRLHIWHPDLPRRNCFEHSAIHNHRFGFVSRVLKGVQKNVRVDLELARDGSHTIISHNGPRSEQGGRISYPVAKCNVYEHAVESYGPGDEYNMPIHQYHHTPNSGVVVTLMRKLEESEIHANSVIRTGIEFHYAFDRFQLSQERLLAYVMEALAA
jgi:hypothetical protein